MLDLLFRAVVLTVLVPSTLAAGAAVATLAAARGATDIAGAGLRTVGTRMRGRRGR